MGQGLFVGLGPLRRSSRDSCSIVGAIPVDETAKAGLDGSIGLEADITGEVGDICGGGNDVTGLDGQHAFHRLLAQTLLDHLDKTEEFDGRMVANVIEAVGRGAGGRVGSLASPLRIGDCGPGHCAHHAFNDVVDVREIALHIALVVNVDWFALENRFGEKKIRHVRPAPRTFSCLSHNRRTDPVDFFHQFLRLTRPRKDLMMYHLRQGSYNYWGKRLLYMERRYIS